MDYIKRSDIIKDYGNEYELIFLNEAHHDHKIIDDRGILRWERNDDVNYLVDSNDLNAIIKLFLLLGYDKNSEIYRKLYRDMGVSLWMYWEVFYWEVNNDKAQEYKPQTK